MGGIWLTLRHHSKQAKYSIPVPRYKYLLKSVRPLLLLYTQPESGTLAISSWLKRKSGWNSKSVAHSSTTRLSEQIATCIVLVVREV
jgi:hypothetical protein